MISLALTLAMFSSLHSMVQDGAPDKAPAPSAQAKAIKELERKVFRLEMDVRRLRSDNRSLERTQSRILEESGDVGVVIFLFGVFCALWAQNTGRSSWLWFFMGVIFNIFTVIVLLSKNASDRRWGRQST